MTLTQQQKALVENVIMVVEETTAKWSYQSRQRSRFIILESFVRIQTMLKHKKPRDVELLECGALSVAEIIGKEVRRARSYKDMTAEEIIEALDTAFKILKGDD